MRFHARGARAARSVGGLLVATAALLPTVGHAQGGADAAAELPLRVPDGPMRDAVAGAMNRSATFRRMIAGLQERRAIVFVAWNPALPQRVGGAIVPRVTTTPDVRYLWVVLKPAGISDHLLAVIAHEIQHALEIIDAGVTDPADIGALFQRLSGTTIRTRIYDTPAADDVTREVERELKASRPRQR